MTLIPTSAGVTLTEVKDRPDLPAYELGAFCMVPGCDIPRERGDGHHVWRRSNQTKSWWVELQDGTLVPNRVGLCPQHHRDVTGELGGHKAAITLNLDRLFLVDVKGNRPIGFLQFAHDPFAHLGEEAPDVHDDPSWSPESAARFGMQQTVDGREVPHEYVVGGHEKFETPVTVVHEHGEIKPGEKCPTCKRRVNHAKKKESPNTKVFGYRVPLGDADTHEELLEAAALTVDKSFTSKPHWKWALVTYALGVVLQGGRLEERGG